MKVLEIFRLNVMQQCDKKGVKGRKIRSERVKDSKGEVAELCDWLEKLKER